MKKITLLVSGVLCAVGLQAQIMSENFDSHTVGDYMGTVSPTYWTTWSGTTGGAEDVQVTDAQANSGGNSIYLSSSAATGGSQDVVIDFGQQYNDGVFTFESAFYVDAGANAYFNLQATPVIGTTWALNCNMSNGTVSIDDGITPSLATTDYTDDTWFTIKIEANLSLGIWKAYKDGTLIGVWVNGITSVASIDIFPLQGGSFYMDDVSFDHQAYTLSTVNAAIAGVDPGGNISGLMVTPTVTVVNGGTDAISSFDVTYDYNGNQYTENVTAALNSLEATDVVFTQTVELVPGALPCVITVSNVNGAGADDVPGDDEVTFTHDPVVPAAGKIVVGEEGTGTWCPWCVRGTVFMDRFEQEYGPYWAGIAVHNGDPMVVADYDAGIGGMISGYPSAVVDRGSDVDPSAMTTDFFDRLQTAPTALITNASTWDAATRELEVTITADFQSAANDGYKLACVLTEDGVTGTGSGYAQANAYAGGGNGVMGGYELLPSPVPAAQMVYDHVARAIEPSFTGDAASFPATVNAGEQHSRTYSFTLPADWNEGNIHIVSMLIDPAGRIDNAGKSSIPGTIGIDELTEETFGLRVFPNPAATFATVEIALGGKSDVSMRLLDMSGKELAARNYGTMEATSTVTLNTSNFEAGVYLVEVIVNGTKVTKRLVIE